MMSITDECIGVTKYPTITNPQQKMEGWVFKNYNKQIMAKYVRAKFKELNNETFGGSVKYEETDDGKFIARYCTNPRIDKQIFSLIDMGYNLELSLMEHLPKKLWNDIVEEHGTDILNSKMTLNLNKIRKLATRRCFCVLQQVITNNALNDGTSEVLQ